MIAAIAGQWLFALVLGPAAKLGLYVASFMCTLGAASRLGQLHAENAPIGAPELVALTAALLVGSVFNHAGLCL